MLQTALGADKGAVMSKRKPYTIYTHTGRAVGQFDPTTGAISKRVKAASALLSHPTPSWTWDTFIPDQVKEYAEPWNTPNCIEPEFWYFAVIATDWGKTFRISWDDFMEYGKVVKWRTHNPQFKQYAVPLDKWMESEGIADLGLWKRPPVKPSVVNKQLGLFDK